MEEIVSSSESDVKKRLKVYKSHRQVQAIPWDHILEVEEEERSEWGYVKRETFYNK